MINIKRTTLITAILVFLLAPNFSSAITVSEIQAQLDAILLKVQELQTQLTQLNQYVSETTTLTSPYPSPSPAPSSPTEWCHTFNTNLKIGDSGPEVQALQTALEKQGLTINQDEKTAGSFGESTASSAVSFQEKYRVEILSSWNLERGTGYVGITTRTKLNRLYGCGGSVISDSGTDKFIGPFDGGTTAYGGSGVPLIGVPCPCQGVKSENQCSNLALTCASQWQACYHPLGSMFSSYNFQFYEKDGIYGNTGKNVSVGTAVVLEGCIKDISTIPSDYKSKVNRIVWPSEL